MVRERHAHVILSGKTLANLMLEHFSDEEIGQIMGWPVKDADHGPAVDVPPGFYEVSWPDHVTVPRYNSDANYFGMVADSVDDLTEEQRALLHQEDR